MLPRSIGSKTVINLADLGAATLLATAASAATPLLGIAAVAGCVGCLAVWSYWGAKGEEAAEADAQRRFRALMDESNGLKGALRKIAAAQAETEMFAADKARELLAFLEAAEHDKQAAAASHEQLLVYIGRKTEESFGETHGKLDALHEAVGAYASDLVGRLDAHGEEARQAAAEIRSAHDHQAESLAAIRDLLRRVEARPQNTLDAHAEIESAVADIKIRSYDVAREKLLRLRRRHYDALSPRERFRVLANLAVIAERDEYDLRQAGALYLDAVEAFPDHEDAHAFRALGHLHLGDEARGREAALAAVQTRPRSSWAHAMAVRSAPRDRTVEQLVEEVPEHLRTDPEVAYALGVRAQKEGKYAEAVRLHRHAAAVSEGAPWVLVQLGFSLIQHERLSHIRRFGGEGLVPDPTHLREGIGLLTRALDLLGAHHDPVAAAQIYSMRGIAASLVGDRDRADADFLRARELHPEDPEIVAQYSLVLADQQRLDDAVAAVRRTVGQVRPDRASLLLVSHLLRRGRPDDRDEALTILDEFVAVLCPGTEAWLRFEGIERWMWLVGKLRSESQAK